MTKKAMLIPLNTKLSCDLCLSVISSKSDSKMVYSVAIMSLINAMGMDSVPSHRCYDPDEEEENFATVIATTDYEVIKGDDLKSCIKGCIDQLKRSGEL